MVVESRRNEKGNRKGKEDRTQNKVERKKNNETGKEQRCKKYFLQSVGSVSACVCMHRFANSICVQRVHSANCKHTE